MLPSDTFEFASTTGTAQTLWKRPIDRVWHPLEVDASVTMRFPKIGAGPEYDVGIDIATGEIVHTAGWGGTDSFGDLETFE